MHVDDRNQTVLFDRLLHALIDETWRLLDLSRTSISSRGLRNILSSCAMLRAADVRRSCLPASELRALLAAAPLLETLRCGCEHAWDEDAVLRILRILRIP